jgi:hypothetical protein
MKQAEKEKIKEKGRQRHRRERKKAAGKKKAGEEEMKELGEEARRYSYFSPCSSHRPRRLRV